MILADLDRVVRSLALPDRVELFPITPHAISSSDVRERVGRGLPIDDLVPAAVAAEIDRLGLYRARVMARNRRYTGPNALTSRSRFDRGS